MDCISLSEVFVLMRQVIVSENLVERSRMSPKLWTAKKIGSTFEGDERRKIIINTNNFNWNVDF